MNDVPGFDESERKGLLGKVINYLDSSAQDMRDVDERREQLYNYFTKKELKLILAKIYECNEREVSFSNFFGFTNLLTDNNIDTIWFYLRDWRTIYFDGGNMDGFLCGFLGKIRRRRQTAVDQTSKTLYDTNRVPEELLRMTSEYLDEPDKTVFLSKIINKGGKKSRRKKSRKNKNKRRRTRRI